MEKLDFGKQLIKIREARGLTQAEVGEKCNITTRTIQRIESGNVKPRASTIKIISKSLGVEFFDTSTQISKFKNQTILWYLKDLFNLKTNPVKKISILSTSALLIIFICISIFSVKAQPNNSENAQNSELNIPDKKVVFSEEFDQFDNVGNFVWTIKNNKYGLSNLEGKVIIPCEYDKLQIEENYIITIKSSKIGVLNFEGDIIIPCEYDKIQIEGDYFVAIKNQKIGVMNLDGKVIIPCEYAKIQIEEGYFVAIKNNKIGLMNLNGKVIIPCEYDNIENKGAYALVTKKGITKRIPI